MPAQFRQRLFDRRNRPAWVILAVSLLLTVLAWYGLRVQKLQSAEQQYELHSRDIIDALANRMRQHEQILLGAAGLFDSSDFVSRAEWHTYVNRLRLERNYPGILGVGFSQVVLPAELSAHIAAVRAEGFPQFTVHPAGKRSLYTSIIYLEPFSGRNLAAFGFDMMSNEVRASAMKRAVEINDTTISGKVKLLQENQGKVQAGFLMYVPVYRANQPLDTEKERWRALRGFVYSPYRMDDLMLGILGERSPWLNFSIYDGDTEDMSARMYDSVEANHAQPRTSAPRWSSAYTIRSYGHIWTVRTYSRRAFEGSFESPMDMVIPVLGGGSSILLFTLASFMAFRRERAEELAREMTDEIRLNEEKLRLSEERLTEGQRIAKLGNWELNLVTGELIWSDEIFRLFEIDKSRFPATYDGFLAAIHPDDRDAVNKAYTDSLVNHRPYEITHRLMMPDGRIKWVQERCTSEFDADGTPLRSRGTVQDITERRNAEEALARISNFNHAIIEGADHLIIATDMKGIIRSFNHSAETHLGYMAEELIGKSTPAVFHDAGEVVQRAKELASTGLAVEPGFEVFVAQARKMFGGDTHEWTYIRKDGSRFPVSLTVTALRDESGEITAFLGIATDITERNLAIQRQRDDATRIAAILDNVLDGIITINDKGSVESFNRGAERIFGYAGAEVVGQNVKMLMPEPYRGQHDGYLHNYMTTGVKKIIGTGRQVVGLRKDGTTFPMDLAVSYMQLGGKQMFTGIVRDITERVRIDQMKSEFISTVSHELRTPLTSIRGSLALLSGGVAGELPEKIKPLVDIAHKNSERLILLVNDILDMEKIEAGKMEFQLAPARLLPLLQQSLDSNRAYAEQYGVSYTLEDDFPGVMLNVDSNRLLQVLANLLSNAAKFSPSGDKVVLSVDSDGQHVRIAVKNRGSGIPEQFRDRIFQKFAQADSSDTRKKGGTGLGLAITKSIVEKMGGSIGFESIPDVLTTFFVEFPLWREEPASAPTEPVFVPEAASREKRILICEDDHDVASLLRTMLEQAGLAADIAYDATRAKEMLFQGEYAAMTLDLGLPDQDGIALIRKLRSTPKTAMLPILVVSGSAAEGRKELNSEAFRIVDWLTKPIDQEQLIAALKLVLGQGASTRPKVLHVEDDPHITRVVSTLIGDIATVETATTLAAARRMLHDSRYTLVILDLSMPDGSGMELLSLLNGASPPVPVLVFSASEMSQRDMRKVRAALVKSRTDNHQLLATIKQLAGID